MVNPLVAGSVDTTSPFSGAYLVEDGLALADAIRSGNWVEGGMAAFSAAVDTAAAVIDPIGTLIANGLGWVLDHVEPLTSWLNDLTGDPGEVAAYAQTWRNVASRMHDTADTFARRTHDLDTMSGATIDAYLTFAGDTIKHLHATGDWADAIAQGMEMASQLVQLVHDLVRDAISQIVGLAISVAAEMALSFGLATPAAIGQITARVASIATRVGRSVTRLLSGFKRLGGLLEGLRALFARASGVIGRMLKGDGPRASLPIAHTYSSEHSAPRLTPDDAARLPKGKRPLPETYLPPDYIREHLSRFDGGATRFMSRISLDKYGISQVDGTTFVLAREEIAELIRTTEGSPRAMEQALGLPEGYFDSGIVRVDIDNPARYGLRVPSGNEAGANDQWMPGGRLPGGFSEGVIDGKDVRGDQFTVRGFAETEAVE